LEIIKNIGKLFFHKDVKGGISLLERYGSMHIIQKVIRNNNDDVIAYTLENGEIITKEEALCMASQGQLSDDTIKN
jgi:hypothetical protein